MINLEILRVVVQSFSRKCMNVHYVYEQDK